MCSGSRHGSSFYPLQMGVDHNQQHLAFQRTCVVHVHVTTVLWASSRAAVEPMLVKAGSVESLCTASPLFHPFLATRPILKLGTSSVTLPSVHCAILFAHSPFLEEVLLLVAEYINVSHLVQAAIYIPVMGASCG